MRVRGPRLASGRIVAACAAALLLGTPLRAVGQDESAAPVSPAASDATRVKSVVELYETLAPAVVRVNIVTEELDGIGKPVLFVSTGFFITPEGRILTSFVESAPVSRVWIEKDGLDYAAEFLGSDPRTSLALVQVLKMPDHTASIPLPERLERPAIGTSVLALGQPLELDVTPSHGLLTGFESQLAERVFPCTYLRTNILIRNGESGSPIIDMTGSLIGVTVARVIDLQSSYLVGTNALKRIVADLDAHGRVRYGTLPIEFAESPDALYVARQVIIANVVPESAAARAGLRSGDVVRRLGDTTIRRLSDVRDTLFFAEPGKYIQIEVERDGQRIPFFSLPIEEMPQELLQPPRQNAERDEAEASAQETP